MLARFQTCGGTWRAILAMVSLAVVASAGCGTVKTSGTARTGTEQLLLTNAWDTAIQQIDFRPLTGVPVFLDVTQVSAIDQGWVVSSLRQAMLTQGVLLRAKAEQAQWIVEARVGAYGTDQYDWLFGIAQTTIPQTITGVPSGTIPEISLAKKNDQVGVAKLALFAYDRGSGQIVWTSGTQIGTSSAKNVYIGGLGPIQSGTIRGGTEFIGMKIPLASDSSESSTSSRSGKRSRLFGKKKQDDALQTAPYDAPALQIPRTSRDLDAFAP
jgi:hypothetical protein